MAESTSTAKPNRKRTVLNIESIGVLLVLFYCSTYLIVFHLSYLFTHPNKMFMPLDQWGLDNQGFTVHTTSTQNVYKQ